MRTLFFALLTFTCVALCQCTVEPFHYADGKRELTSLGMSLLTKTKAQSRTITKGEMTMMSASEGKNEVGMPMISTMGALVGQGIKEAGDIGNSLVK